MLKFDLLKKLEYLIAFQYERLENKDWDSFDRAEEEVKRLEEDITHSRE